MFFYLLTIDPVKTATALSNPYIWGGVLLFVLIAAVVFLWRQLTAERKESREDFKEQLVLLTKVELQLVEQQGIKPLLEEIKLSIELIKQKIE